MVVQEQTALKAIPFLALTDWQDQFLSPVLFQLPRWVCFQHRPQERYGIAGCSARSMLEIWTAFSFRTHALRQPVGHKVILWHTLLSDRSPLMPPSAAHLTH